MQPPYKPPFLQATLACCVYSRHPIVSRCFATPSNRHLSSDETLARRYIMRTRQTLLSFPDSETLLYTFVRINNISFASPLVFGTLEKPSYFCDSRHLFTILIGKISFRIIECRQEAQLQCAGRTKNQIFLECCRKRDYPKTAHSISNCQCQLQLHLAI